jgi:hypothetical protein
MIKKLVLLSLAALVCLSPLAAQQPATEQKKQQGPRPRTSPHETTGAVIAGSRVTVIYGRPYSARGGKGEPRKIWGELVPDGKVWRLGADEATLLVTQHPIDLGGTTVPAGAHTLWMLPNSGGTAKLIVNKQVGQWGVPRPNQDPKEVYDEAKDVARVDLKKEPVTEQVDQLLITIQPTTGNEGVLKITWEKTVFSVPFTVKK